MKNKLALTAISFLANFIMAGFASQFGMLIEPIANSYNADINAVASVFIIKWGALAGTVAAFFLIERIGVKRMTCISYSIVFLCALAMHWIGDLGRHGCHDAGGFLWWYWLMYRRNYRCCRLA